MYLSKEIDKAQKHTAIIVGTPYDGVKEQGAGIYAQEMAQRGFVSIAFDESYNEEPELIPAYPSKPVDIVPEGLDPIWSEFFGYYAMERGFHPNAIGSFTTTSAMSFMNFSLMNYR